MGTTSIEWTRNPDGTKGKSWNPIRGCSRVSPGCGGAVGVGGCYAEGIAARFSGPGQAYEGFAEMTERGPRWTGKVALVPEHLDDPLRWRKPQRVFVNSTSDLFHERLTNEQIAAVFGVMAAARRHTFMVLTKRAEQMRAWFVWAEKRGHDGAAMFADDPLDWRIRQMLNVSARRAGADMNADDRQNHGGPWPLPNVIVGVSVEDQRRADERMPHLVATAAALRMVSCEPLLGPVDLSPWLAIPKPTADDPHATFLLAEAIRDGRADAPRAIDLVIAGAESGRGARAMNEDWVRSLRDQCVAAVVPFFYKQRLDERGHKVKLPMLDGRQWDEFPEVAR